MSLIELLCVMVIIAILMSLLLPTISRAYMKVKGMAEEVEAPSIADLIVTSSRKYCSNASNFVFVSKSDFANKCDLPPKGRDWVAANTTEFIPFGHMDWTNKVVMVVHYGKNRGRQFSFTKGQLSITPD